MRIVKCCEKVRLPGGERKWLKMAGLAEFNGTINIRPFTHKSKLAPDSYELGEYRPSRSAIRVRINHTHGLNLSVKGYNPIDTLGHELGHHILRLKGRPWASNFKSVSAQSHSPVERACDRYARLLKAKT
jgi:hypothetical protein